MKSTNVGAGSIASPKEKLKRLPKELEGSLPVNPPKAKPSNENVSGKNLSRTKGGAPKM